MVRPAAPLEQADKRSQLTGVSHWHYKETGVKSRPIKLIRHPIEHLERKIFLNYFLACLFKLLAFLTGPPLVLLVALLVLPLLLLRRLLWRLLNKLLHLELYVGSGCGQWRYCPLDYLEAYWLRPELVNNILLVVEAPSGDLLSLSQLRSLVRRQILAKPEFRKFLARVVQRGLPLYRGHYWHHLGLEDNDSDDVSEDCKQVPEGEDEDFSSAQFSTTSGSSYTLQEEEEEQEEATKKVSLSRHIRLDSSLLAHPRARLRHVRRHLHALTGVHLNMDRPLWEMRLLPTSSKKRCYVIVRCHQALADGRQLAQMLAQQLTSSEATPRSCRVSLEAATDSQEKGDDEKRIVQEEEEDELKPLKEKASFVERIGAKSGFKSAILVGPLTLLLWLIWTFTRRKHNHLNGSETSKKVVDQNQRRRFYMSHYNLTKFHQVKQMTRGTVGDLLLCALAGALRDYLRHFNAVSNPPNLNVSLAVDMSSSSSSSKEDLIPRNRCSLLQVPLPTSVEGAVPRLWKLRQTMEELRGSADPWVMLGLQKVAFALLPLASYQWLVNRLTLANSSAFVSQVRGPGQQLVESWCVDLFQRALLESQRPPRILHQDQFAKLELHEVSMKSRKRRLPPRIRATKGSHLSSIYYCMQPPTPDIPISFNCITYHDRLYVTVLTRSLLAEDAKQLVRLLFRQLDQLADTVAKRRQLVSIVSRPAPSITDEIEASTRILEKTLSPSGDFEQVLARPLVPTPESLEKDEDDDFEKPRKLTAGGSEPELGNLPPLQKQPQPTRRRSLFTSDHSYASSLLSKLRGPQPAASARQPATSDDHRKPMKPTRSSLSLAAAAPREARDLNRPVSASPLVEATASQSKKHPKGAIVQLLAPSSSFSASSAATGSLTVSHCEGSRIHSRSETDLLPCAAASIAAKRGSPDTNKAAASPEGHSRDAGSRRSESRDSWLGLKMVSIFSRGSHQQQRDVERGGSAEEVAVGGGRKWAPPQRSRRRQSVATTSPGRHQHQHHHYQQARAVVVKDEMNADVGLRVVAPLDSSALFGRRNRRFSAALGGANQGSGGLGGGGEPRQRGRRSSLIPFGLIQNQAIPRLYLGANQEQELEANSEEAHV